MTDLVREPLGAGDEPPAAVVKTDSSRLDHGALPGWLAKGSAHVSDCAPG